MNERNCLNIIIYTSTILKGQIFYTTPLLEQTKNKYVWINLKCYLYLNKEMRVVCNKLINRKK